MDGDDTLILNGGASSIMLTANINSGGDDLLFQDVVAAMGNRTIDLGSGQLEFAGKYFPKTVMKDFQETRLPALTSKIEELKKQLKVEKEKYEQIKMEKQAEYDKIEKAFIEKKK